MKVAQHTRIATLLLAFLLAGALAATPAGTVIRNQAAALVEGETYYSNPVETVVLSLCSASLVPDGTPASPGQSSNTTVGGSAYLTYQLTNTGNDTFTYDLAVYQDASSDWTPVATALYEDLNMNAQVDPGENEIQQITLDAGETAWLVLEVEAPDHGSGDLYVSPAATCPSGDSDSDNYGRVSLLSGPALQVEKTIAPVQVSPGDSMHVSLVVRNVGDEPTGDTVTLTDDISALDGVSYVPGSAVAPKGSIEYYDGAAWSTTEPAAVEGIRLVLDGLEVGEEAILDFDLSVDEGASPELQQNVATAEGPGGPADSVATFEILPRYDLYLGPGGNPRANPGGEGSPDDYQQASLIEGQEYCFEHTLENASNVADTFDLDVSGLPDGVTGVFRVSDTLPLSRPVALGPGEKIDFLYCVTASDLIDPFTLDLVATSAASGSSNHTYDEVQQVLPADGIVPVKTVDPEGTVIAGSELTYTLRFANEYPIDLTNVVVDDWLSDDLEYVSSTPAGSYDAARHRVQWEVPTLATGAEWVAELKVRVKREVADDTSIENRFIVRADQAPNGIESNITETPVWSTNLLLKKNVTPGEVRFGDRLHYTLLVSNPSTAALTITVTDSPDPHLEYIPGSSEPKEPEQVDGKLVWTDMDLGPGETLTITYDMRVLAGAPKELLNTAIAEGVSSSGAAVASSRATTTVRSVERVFLTKRATIVGRVYFDANKDGRYDPEEDLPLPGARLLLSDGRQVLTDAYGNYAFRDIEAGIWQVALDANTAPFPPLPHPEALNDGYHHRVPAWGLTTSDFPLAMPAGLIDAIRETSLFMGPLRVDKRVIPLSKDSYRVVLHIQSSEPLPDLVVIDPLPDGGEKTFSFAEFKGDETITYELTGSPVLTDPEVRWRYP